MAIHEGADVDRDHSQWFTEVFHIAWRHLRVEFVTTERALLLAGALSGAYIERRDGSRRQLFSDVYLYGSLARHEADPEDIDLLLVDTLGVVTWLESGYHHEPVQKEIAMLQQIDEVNDTSHTFCTKATVRVIDRNQRSRWAGIRTQ